jgi:hypothetical protein
LYVRFAPKVYKDDAFACNFWKEGQVVQLTQREFRELTGKQFIPFFETAIVDIPRVKDVLPKVVETAQDQLCLAQEEKMGFGVKVIGAIKKGAVISPFAGEIIRKGVKKYAVDVYGSNLGENLIVDGSRKSNLGVFINDGPPNCGILNKHVFALRDLKPGEYLRLDYGAGHLAKVGHYHISETSYQELAAVCQMLFKEETLMTALRRWIETSVKLDKRWESHEVLMIVYALGTFNMLVKLYLRGVIDPKATRKVIEHAPLLLNGTSYSKNYPAILDTLDKIKKTGDQAVWSFIEKLPEKRLCCTIHLKQHSRLAAA